MSNVVEHLPHLRGHLLRIVCAANRVADRDPASAGGHGLLQRVEIDAAQHEHRQGSLLDSRADEFEAGIFVECLGGTGKGRPDAKVSGAIKNGLPYLLEVM